MEKAAEFTSSRQNLLDLTFGTTKSITKKTLQCQKPHQFFAMLRTGYLLSRIAMIAVPTSADIYRGDINTDAVTR